jgi:hypothetical protein
MKTMLLCTMGLVSQLSASTLAIAADASPQEWFVQRCAPYGKGYCRVPFQVAFANAKKIASLGQRVLIRGFLVREPSGFALYESRDSAAIGWRTDAVLLDQPTDAELQHSLTRWNESLVEVRGTLSLVASDHEEYWVQFKIDAPVNVAGVRGEKLRR